MVALITLNVPPGVQANGEQFQVGQQGRWWRSNLVRFRAGLLMPVGGWQRRTPAPLPGISRGMHVWRDNSLRRRMAIGSTETLHVFGDDGKIDDITPEDFTPGRTDGFYADGYGFGPYGASTYGTPRQNPDGRLLVGASTWSMDNWGERLVAVASHEGVIYEWEPGEEEAVPVTDAPGATLALIVTPERHLAALGAGGNPRRVQWSSREDNTDWTPMATNSAGDFELQTQGVIQCALKVRGEILILTDLDAHSMRFVGQPAVYGFEVAGSGCGVIGPKAAVTADGWAAWMSTSGFFVYDGSVRDLPSAMHDFVFSDINLDQGGKIHAGANTEFSEIWWFYCSAQATEIDRYVLWNYNEQTWAHGTLHRTAWAPAGTFPNPFLMGTDGHLYEHETGWTASGEPLCGQRFAETGALSLGAGEQVMSVMQMFPDERSLGDTRAVFKTRFFPNAQERAYGPYTLTARTDTRFQARQVALRVEGVADSDWRIGLPRLDVLAGGKR